MTPAASNVRPERLKALFRQMVDIYSPSGKEHELVDYLVGRLRAAGLPVTVDEVGDKRCNIAVAAPGTHPAVAFLGHVDTVPAFDIEHYEFDERDGVAYGLGTADMKGGCAAMIEAFVAFFESGGQQERAGLYLVVGEEESGDGTARLLERESFEWAVVGEPTNLVPCFSHYSYCEMLVRAFGTRRHASMAGQEHNAILSMLRMLLQLAEQVERDRSDCILNIRDLSSSESGFAVPDRCSAWVDLHIPPAESLGILTAELEQVVRESLAGSVVTHYETGFPTVAQGYELPHRGLLPDALRSVYRDHQLDWSPGAFRSHSDANLLWKAGCKPVILGPGQLACAHTRDESVALESVNRAAELYAATLLALHR